MKIQEKLDEKTVLKTLQTGHDAMSDEMVSLLIFDIKKVQDVIKKEYELFKEDMGYDLNEEKISTIEKFLSQDINPEKVTLAEYNEYKEQIKLIDEILYRKTPIVTYETLEKTIENLIDNMFTNRLLLELEDAPYQEYRKIFDALPNFLEVLLLNDSNIGDMEIDDVVELFRKLPISLKFISLRDCDLDGNPIDEYYDLFGTLPRGLTGLDISGNSFGLYSAEEFFHIIKALPRQLKSLNMGKSRLWQVKPGDLPINDGAPPSLATILEELPPELEVLYLGGNGFGTGKRWEFPANIQALPRGLKKLDLSENSISKLTKGEFRGFIDALPPNLEYLDLRINGLFEYSEKDLKIIFENLPSSLKKIDMSKNQMFGYDKLRMGIREDVEVVF